MHKEFIIKVNPVKYNETVSEVNNGIKTEIVIKAKPSASPIILDFVKIRPKTIENKIDYMLNLYSLL